jgi:hypothetical protein
MSQHFRHESWDPSDQWTDMEKTEMLSILHEADEPDINGHGQVRIPILRP